MIRKKILVLEDSSQSDFGGGQRVTLEILNRTDLDSSVIVIDSIRASWHSKLKAKIKVVTLFSEINDYKSILFNLMLIFKSISAIWQGQPSKIYVTTRKQFFPALFYKLLAPSVDIFFHVHLTTRASFWWYLYDLLVNQLCTKIIFTSEFTLHDFEENRPFLDKDKSIVSPLPPQKWHTSQIINCNIPSDPFVIAYIGRISEEKGIFFFLEILNKLPVYLNWQGIIAGTGEAKEKLLYSIKSKGLSEKVKYMEQVDTDVKFYSKISLLVIPSFWHIETICLTAVEGMQAGIPILVSNNGNLSTFINQGSAYAMNEPEIDTTIETIEKIYIALKKYDYHRVFYHVEDGKKKSLFQNFYTEVFSNRMTKDR